MKTILKTLAAAIGGTIVLAMFSVGVLLVAYVVLSLADVVAAIQ